MRKARPATAAASKPKPKPKPKPRSRAAPKAKPSPASLLSGGSSPSAGGSGTSSPAAADLSFLSDSPSPSRSPAKPRSSISPLASPAASPIAARLHTIHGCLEYNKRSSRPSESNPTVSYGQGNCRGGRSASLPVPESRLPLRAPPPPSLLVLPFPAATTLASSSSSSSPATSVRQMEVPMNSAQSSAHFPVQHQSLSLDIKGNKTDIVISKYEDTFLVIVTQIGCMGTILAAKKEESVFSDPTYNVSVLFGKRDEPLLLACASQLIEHISGSGSARSLVISLGLKDHSQGTLKDIIAAMIQNRLW